MLLISISALAGLSSVTYSVTLYLYLLYLVKAGEIVEITDPVLALKNATVEVLNFACRQK